MDSETLRLAATEQRGQTPLVSLTSVPQLRASCTMSLSTASTDCWGLLYGRFTEGAYKSRHEFKRRKADLVRRCVALVLEDVLRYQEEGFRVQCEGQITRHWMPHIMSYLTDDEEHGCLMCRNGFNCGTCMYQKAQENDKDGIGDDVQCRTMDVVEEEVTNAQKTGKYGGVVWKEGYTRQEPIAMPLLANPLDAANDGVICPPLRSRQRYDHCGSHLGVKPDTNPLWRLRKKGGTFDVYQVCSPEPMHMVELGLMVRIMSAVVLSFRVCMGVHDDEFYTDEQEGEGVSRGETEDSGWDSEQSEEDVEGGGGGAREASDRKASKQDLETAMGTWKKLARNLREGGMSKFVCDRVYQACCHGKNNRGKVDFGLTADETLELFKLFPAAIENLLPANNSEDERVRAAPEVVMRCCTEAMCAMSRWYWKAKSPWHYEDELPMIHGEAVHLLWRLRESLGRVMKWKNPKTHMLLHVVGSCLQVTGAWCNCSGEVVELNHTIFKAACARTNRKPGWEGQMFRGLVRLNRYHSLAANMEVAGDEDDGDDQVLDVGEDLDESDREDERPLVQAGQDWSDWRDSQTGECLAVYHVATADLGTRIRRKVKFPGWEAAVDWRNTVVSLEVRSVARKRGEGEKGSERYVNIDLVKVAKTQCDWPGKHLQPAMMRGLPTAMARYFVAVNARGCGEQPYSEMEKERVMHLLASNVKTMPGCKVVAGAAPIQVYSQLVFENNKLTGGAEAWGKLLMRRRVHRVRSFPFKNLTFHGHNAMPVVAYVAYPRLGPETEASGARSRPRMKDVRVEDMVKRGGGDQGVRFGKVMLLFASCVQGDSGKREVRQLACLQPLLRYIEPRDGACYMSAADAAWVRLYEPSQHVGEDDMHDVVPVVVEVCRILCEVPTVPSFGKRNIPVGVDVGGMPGAVATAGNVVGSPLVWANLLELQWHRTNVLHVKA